jgi:flagellar capping protein FliD
LSQLKGAMSSFQAALSSLKDSSAYVLRKATVGDATAFTAVAGSSAAAGKYDIDIVQLARAAQLKSAPFVAGASAIVGTGTLVLSMGAASFNIAGGPEYPGGIATPSTMRPATLDQCDADQRREQSAVGVTGSHRCR